jgi:hypothetical protein
MFLPKLKLANKIKEKTLVLNRFTVNFHPDKEFSCKESMNLFPQTKTVIRPSFIVQCGKVGCTK